MKTNAASGVCAEKNPLEDIESFFRERIDAMDAKQLKKYEKDANAVMKASRLRSKTSGNAPHESTQSGLKASRA
jgi:hypothetical protein